MTSAARVTHDPLPGPPIGARVVVRCVRRLVAERGVLLGRTRATAIVRGPDGHVRTWPLVQYLVEPECD